MQLDLTGKHALVCGASEGIGRAAAHELAALGADVTVLARRGEALDEVVAQLPLTHGAQKHGRIAADMDDATTLQAKVGALVAGHRVHILVNNTAGPAGGPAFSASTDDYLATFKRHLIGGQMLVQSVLDGMKEAGYGRIVNVISTSVKEPIANLGVSNTVRGAVASWAKTLASELASHGITVNSVLPGFTETGRLASIIATNAKASGRNPDEIAHAMLATVPTGRFGKPEEIASVIAFLCTPAAAYVNGVALAVDGGRTRSL